MERCTIDYLQPVDLMSLDPTVVVNIDKKKIDSLLIRIDEKQFFALKVQTFFMDLLLVGVFSLLLLPLVLGV